MKLYTFAFCLTFAIFSCIAAELPLAKPCNETECQLPSCRCSSTNIPGGLAPQDTPQVNANEVIDWVKDPIPLNEYIVKDCRQWTPTECRRSSCNAITANHTEKIYYLQICNECPNEYPWVNNPLGL